MLFAASQDAHNHTAPLVDELLRWPHVKMYRAFGTLAFYHWKTMFAILPDKRSAGGPNGISFRAAVGAESREDEVRWDTLDLKKIDFTSALKTLERAYRCSGKRPFSEPVFLPKNRKRR
jgi:hypothetical protein